MMDDLQSRVSRRMRRILSTSWSRSSSLLVPDRSRATGITVELQGGLGNQLFGFAAGVAQAHRLGVPLHLNYDETRHVDSRSFELSKLLGPGILFGKEKHPRTFLREAGFSYDSRVMTIEPGTVLIGYFQSWKYFSTVTSQIRGAIASDFSASSTTGSKGPVLPYIAVQVRRGDYLNPQTAAYHGICEFEYFARGLNLLRQQLGNLPGVVFSDDPLTASEFADRLPGCQADFSGSDEPTLETLLRMSGASGLVISNSSFGWWGAWLSGEAVPCVAPTPWFSNPRIDTSDLIPEGWQTLNRDGL